MRVRRRWWRRACLGISAVEDRLWAGLIVEDAKTVDSGDMEPRMASNGQGGGVWRG